MRVIQPSIANRITFATLARKAGLRRHSSVSYYVPDDFEVPARLMVGAQVDGKPYQAPSEKPKRTRKPKAQVEPPVDLPDQQERAGPGVTELGVVDDAVGHSEPERWQPRTQQPDTTEEES